MTAAKMVDVDVNKTDNATSAFAIKDTKLDAVPPGAHPTKDNPKNNVEAMDLSGRVSNMVVPTSHAARGMIPN